MVLIGDNNFLQTMQKMQNPHDLELVMTKNGWWVGLIFSLIFFLVLTFTLKKIEIIELQMWFPEPDACFARNNEPR